MNKNQKDKMTLEKHVQNTFRIRNVFENYLISLLEIKTQE